MTDSTTLTARGIKASFWAVFATYTTQAIRIFTMLYVAAMLSPDDFGLFSMATVAAGFFSIFGSLGLNSALTWNRDNPEAAAGTAFWLKIIGSMFTSFLIFSFSSYLAQFFNEPRLTMILKVIAFEPIVGMFTTVHFTLLDRELRFRQKYWLGFISSLGGNCVLVTLAYLGMGVWSFIASTYVSIVLASIYLFFFAGIKFPLCYDNKMAAKLLRFGLVAGFNNYLLFLTFNLDYAIVGKILDSVQLGYYSFAYRFANIPANYISHAVIAVAFPIFAIVKDNPKKMLKGYVKGTHWLTMAGMPVAVILALFGPDIIDELYGEKWSPAYNAFRILCLYGLTGVIIAPVGSILYAVGKPSYEMWVSIFRIITALPLAICVGSIHGIDGIAVVFTGVFIVSGILSIWLVKIVFGAGWMDLLKPICLTAISCMLGIGASYLVEAFIPHSGRSFIAIRLSVFITTYLLAQYGIDKEFSRTIRAFIDRVRGYLMTHLRHI